MQQCLTQPHPTDEQIELYCRAPSGLQLVREMEEHLRDCSRCAQAVMRVVRAEFDTVRAIRAGSGGQPEPSVDIRR